LVYTPYAKKGQAAQAQATAPAKPDPAAAPRAAQAAQAAPAAVPPIATAVTTAPIPPQVVAQVLLATPPQPPVGISATPIGASPPGSGPTAPAREVAAGTSFAIRLEDAMTHFEFDNAELTETGRMTLDAWLKQLPPGLRVRITGHADRFGSNRYNMSLSRRRAESVKHYLADKGMRAEDMVVFAKGETQPLVHCKGGATPKTKACLAPNRRVEIKRN
jgi:OOP family OmpA-OmpF porin